MGHIRTTVFLLLFVSQFGFLQGNNLFISPLGSDLSGNGTMANPWMTVKKACQVALPGDTINILPGTYLLTNYDSFTPRGSSSGYITIRPYTPNTVVFDGSLLTGISSTTALLRFNQGYYAVLEGVEVRNSAGRGIHVYQSHHIIVRNCLVHDIDYRGIGGSGHYVTIEGNECYNCVMSNENQAFSGGGWAGVISTSEFSTTGEASTHWTISNNSVHHSWGEGIITGHLNGGVITGNTVYNVFSVSIYVDYGIHQVIENNYLYFNDPLYKRDGIYETDGIKWAVEYRTENMFPGYGVEDLLIRNNLIAGCRKAFSWYHQAPAAGIRDFYSYKDIRIIHNTGYGLTNAGLYLYEVVPDANQPAGCEFRDNIMDKGLTLQNATAWSFSHNNWVGGIPTAGSHPDSFSADPLFISAMTGGPAAGFKVPATSPCVDAGVISMDCTTDYFGTEWNAEAPTVGFYEYAAACQWNGSVSRWWTDPANWTPAGVPSPYHDVMIPSGTPNLCQVNAEEMTCKSMEIKNGATLTVSETNSLNIRGGLVINPGGAIINNGTLRLKGNLDNRNTE